VPQGARCSSETANASEEEESCDMFPRLSFRGPVENGSAYPVGGHRRRLLERDRWTGVSVWRS